MQMAKYGILVKLLCKYIIKFKKELYDNCHTALFLFTLYISLSCNCAYLLSYSRKYVIKRILAFYKTLVIIILLSYTFNLNISQYKNGYLT